MRWWHHKYYAKKGSTKCPKLYSAIRKYGEQNFEWAVLEECDVSELYTKEQWWLDNNFSEDNYNVSKSADAPMRGKVFSKEHKDKLKLARQNRIFSSETRQKMSISRMGKKFENPKMRGAVNHKTKYTKELILEIREAHFKGESAESIRKRHSIPKTSIWNILRRRTWAYV